MDFIMNFDFSILDFIAENIRIAFLNPIMMGFSLLVHKGIGVLVLGIILLIPRKTRYAAVIALVSAVVALLLGEFAIKLLVQRPRPFVLYEEFHSRAIPAGLVLEKASGYSFPSMHTAFAFSFATSMFVFSKKVGIIAIIIALLIGFSRLYNYVHFPSDVLAGAFLGVIVSIFVILIFNKLNIEKKVLKIRQKN